jgi:hypothetical protein
MSRKNTGAGKQSSHPAGVSTTVRALPGAGPVEASRPEWIDVTVMPREVPRARARPRPTAAPPPDRRAVYEQGLQENARFRESLMSWLDAHNLRHQVRAVSEEGGSLPMLTLRCAPRVLDQLRRAPEFEAGATMPMEYYPSTY